MDRAGLRIVRDAPAPRRPAGAAAGLVVLAAALAATWLGADDARKPFSAPALAESALAAALSGADPQAAQRAAEELRDRLARVPLDALTRTAFANLLVETADSEAGRAAAASQAMAATDLVASDEWIATASARVLARCGRTGEALDAIAAVFAYAPGAAAITLAGVEPFVAEGNLERGLPATAPAWRAWSIRLREMGREREADARLASLLERWPDDLEALGIAARVAAARDRMDELARLVPADRTLPDERGAAPLYAYRARVRAEGGDEAGAAADVSHATALAGDDPWVEVACGDALARFDAAGARARWTHALYVLEAADTPATSVVWVRFRLARLDDREGRGAEALRTWRSILAVRPDSDEARRRIRELSGGSVR